jgi:hypothetical protein
VAASSSAWRINLTPLQWIFMIRGTGEGKPEDHQLSDVIIGGNEDIFYLALQILASI